MDNASGAKNSIPPAPGTFWRVPLEYFAFHFTQVRDIHIKAEVAAFDFMACIKGLANYGYTHQSRFNDLVADTEHFCDTTHVKLVLREAEPDDEYLTYQHVMAIMDGLLESTAVLSGNELYDLQFEVWDVDASGAPIRCRVDGIVEIARPNDGSQELQTL